MEEKIKVTGRDMTTELAKLLNVEPLAIVGIQIKADIYGECIATVTFRPQRKKAD